MQEARKAILPQGGEYRPSVDVRVVDPANTNVSASWSMYTRSATVCKPVRFAEAALIHLRVAVASLADHGHTREGGRDQPSHLLWHPPAVDEPKV